MFILCCSITVVIIEKYLSFYHPSDVIINSSGQQSAVTTVAVSALRAYVCGCQVAYCTVSQAAVSASISDIDALS